MPDESVLSSGPRQRAAALSPERRALLDKWRRGTTRAPSTQCIPRRTGTEVIPLSFQQQRLWFLDQLEPGTSFYTGTLPLQLQGSLRSDLLAKSLSQLVARHESLRTSFPTQAGRPHQQIAPPAPLPLPMVDLQALTPADQLAARQAIQQVLMHALRLDRGPLLHACVLRQQPQLHLLLLTMHHTIVDGLSLQIMRQELAALYQALLTPSATQPLPALPIQYADYALWQQDWLQSQEMEAQLQYWREHLQGAPTLHSLPTDHPRPPVQSYRGALIRQMIPPALAAALKHWSQQEGVTLFMTTLAAFQILLARLSGQSDLVVGTPIANRTRPELASLVGFFANTLALRADLSGRPTLRQYLMQVRARALAAYAHQEMPFERLVEALQPPRSLSHHPLFQVMFSLDELTLSATQMGELQMQAIQLPNDVAQFDLSLAISESEQGMGLLIQYSTDLFETATIQRLLQHYLTLLAAIVRDPECSIDALPLLDDEERAHLHAGWRRQSPEDEAPPAQECLYELLAASAEARPDAVAMVDGEQSLTAGACHARARALANRLRARGVGAECVVAICLARSPELLLGLLAVLQAGGAYLLLDPDYPAQRLNGLLQESQASLLLTYGALPVGVQADEISLLDLAAPDPESSPGAQPACDVGPANLAYVIYTSGSSGAPKGVMISQAALLSQSKAIARRFTLQPGDRVLQAASLSFDVAGEEIFPTWLAGACLVLSGPRSPLPTRQLTTLLWQQGLTVLNLPTSYWYQWLQELLESEQGLPATLRLVITGSESASGAQLARWRAYAGPRVSWLHAYGVSEATITSTLYEPTGDEQGTLPIGHPLEQTRVYLLDEAMQPVPAGVVADLYLGGTSLARGYLRRPDLTAERFLPHPFASERGERFYRSGDRARARADGTLEFLGRSDQQLNIYGYRIEPGEIEARLREHPAIQEAVVNSWQLSGGGQQLIAYILPQAYARCSEQELRAFLSTRLPSYLLPQRYCLLASLPLTPGGKIDRAALVPAPAEELTTGESGPRTTLEALLAEIWAELLGCERVSVFASFFALGGHSLLATRLIAQIRQTLQVDLPLHTLFRAPTIAELAEAIAHVQGKQDYAQTLAHLPTLRAAPGERGQPFPLTDVLQAYWMGQNAAFELGNVSTHAYLEIWRRDLDLRRLTLAWQRLVARHDLLRAIILPEGQMQILDTESIAPYEIALCDLRALDEPTGERALAEIRQQFSHQMLPTDLWPQFALQVTRLPDGRDLLHLSLGPLTGDGTSWAILDRELAHLYADPQALLPELTISYRDYVLAELELKASPLYQQARDYWLARLPTLPPAPQLPLARNPATLQAPRFTRRSLLLPPVSWQAIKGRAATYGLTPSGVVLGAFAEVLARWGKSTRFTINLTVFNRLPLHPQVNDLVGDFTSLSLLEVDASRVHSFAELARRVQQQLWADLDQRSFDGVQVLRELARVQGTALQARMPIVFTSTLGYQAREREAPVFIRGNVGYSITQTPQVWIDNQVFESQGALTISWDAVEELFPAGLLDAMFAAYQQILTGLAESESSWQARQISQLPQAQRALQQQLNQTEAPQSVGLLYTPFLARLRQQPDAPAVIAPRRTLSYQELYLRACQVAQLVLARGVLPGSLVAIVMEKGWEQVVAALGIQFAGAAYLPLDADLPSERLSALCQHGEVSLALTQSRVSGQISWPSGVAVISLDTLSVESEQTEPPPGNPEPGDLAYVIYTSGSTGEPKGVMIEHASALNTILDMNERFSVGPGDRVLALSALTFDLSVYDIFGILAAGAALVLPEASARQDPAHWAQLLAAEQITLWNTVPALLDLLVEYLTTHGRTLPTSLRLALLSGDWIPLTLPEQVSQLAPHLRVISLGGATEASIWSILYPIERVEPTWQSIPYGRPMRNQRFFVLNERAEACPTWVAGQLYIGGPGLARGYWHDPVRTADSFLPHPTTGERLYRTGDLGRFLPDGTLEFLGREDFQVKVQGYRVELGEIEACLARLPDIQAAVVVARGPRQGNRHLVAYLVLRAGALLSPEEVRTYLQQHLPAYMLPSSVVLLPRLPLSANGKVDRKALPEPVSATATQREASDSGLPGPLVQQIAALLQVEQLSGEQNLLELGANSVDMLRILNLLEKELHVRPPLAEFFRQPTLHFLGLVRPRHSPQAETAATADETAFPLLRDPAEHQAWKLQHRELRRDSEQHPLTVLPACSPQMRQQIHALARRSQRHFLQQPLPLEQLSDLLECLRQISPTGEGQRLYPSAGAIYPIQVYLYIKAGSVDSLQAGIYYYHPGRHQLVCLAPGVTLDPQIYDPLANQPIFAEAAFALFLIAQPAAIMPIYGPGARDFCLLEAGSMSQLLMQTAARCQLGLCPIGGLDFARIERFFALEAHQFLVHSLLGGAECEEGEL